jgi:pantoate kinase
LRERSFEVFYIHATKGVGDCMLSRRTGVSLILVANVVVAVTACEQRSVVVNQNQGSVGRAPTRAPSPCNPPAGIDKVFAPASTPIVRVRGEPPERAKVEHVNGCAGIQFHIGSDGLVTDARLVTEYPVGYGFGASALKAVSSSRFDPNPDASKWFFVINNFVFR